MGDEENKKRKGIRKVVKASQNPKPIKSEKQRELDKGTVKGMAVRNAKQADLKIKALRANGEIISEERAKMMRKRGY